MEWLDAVDLVVIHHKGLKQGQPRKDLVLLGHGMEGAKLTKTEIVTSTR
jgi:hypothetical protein